MLEVAGAMPVERRKEEDEAVRGKRRAWEEGRGERRCERKGCCEV